jgi:hypothetical protein
MEPYTRAEEAARRGRRINAAMTTAFLMIKQDNIFFFVYFHNESLYISVFMLLQILYKNTVSWQCFDMWGKKVGV